MENLILPKQYKSELNLHDTQLAIKTVKDFFQALLAQRLHLTRVSAPLFVGLSLVSCQPEKINRLPKEVCVGKVRKYSIRMIRLVKLVFIIGLMVPCVGDVIGIELKDAYSLLVIAAILVITVFYEYRIIQLLRNDHHDQGQP